MITCHACGSEKCALFTKKNGHRLYRCESCRLLFVYPIPTAPVQIYDRGYFDGASNGFGYENYDEDKEPMRSAFLKYLDLIRKSIGLKARLLDVGAATGYFVAMAKEAGFEAEGVDISEYAVSLGRAKGLRLHVGTIDDMDGMYDCITMLDVIEHVPDPRRALKKASSLLRSGGLLVINTPDAGSLTARMLGPYWHLIIPPEHLMLFDRRNLRRILEDAGFEIPLVTTIGKRYTFKYIFKFLHSITGKAIFLSISKFFSRDFFSRLAIPINLRDNMFVLARKK